MHKFTYFSIVFFYLMLQSWIADSIKGDALFPWWPYPAGPLVWGSPANIIVLLIMIALAGLCIVYLYKKHTIILPIHVQRIGEPGQADPHEVLVLAISRTSWVWMPDALKQGDTKSVALPANLDAALAVMSELSTREKFSWEQILRAISQHSARINTVILLGSKNGTEDQFESCSAMIMHYFPILAESAFKKCTADFESLDDLLRVYRQIVNENKDRKRCIMIDVTGGTKVVSIAAAMVSLEHPEIEFQYVETEGKKRVRCFNAISQRQDSDQP